jgi:phage portal protein BeeE
MALIETNGGGYITIGSFAGGYPELLTTGDRLTTVDPGVPLREYSAKPTDPLKLWKTQPSLRKVVSFIAREIAQIPWHAYQRVGDHDRRRQQSSPAERIMAQPAPLVDGYQLITALVTDLCMYDVCCAVYLDRELVRIPPSLLRIRSDVIGRVVDIWIEPGKDHDDVEITDLPKIMTWGWHPTRAGGVSPMHTLAGILHEQIASVEWRTQQWAQTPKMSGYLTRPSGAPRLSGDQRDKLQKLMGDWKSAKAGGTPIFEHGMEFKSLTGISPADAKDIQGRQLTDAEVASAFHIQPELVGARAGNFSNIDAFRQMLFGPTLGPLISQLQQAVNNGGLLEATDTTEGIYLEVNREAVLNGSLLEQVRYLQSATGGPFMLRAEARGRLNLPFIDGTDELIVPLNVEEGGQASPTDTGDQNLGGENADPSAREDTQTIT